MISTSLPVSADLENRYAESADGIAETIRPAAEAGLVGGSIEDGAGDPDAPIFPFDVAVERVRAAVTAARRLAGRSLTHRAASLLLRPVSAVRSRLLQPSQRPAQHLLLKATEK